MKKILIILISFIFIFNSCGYMALFYSYQKKIKRDIKRQIFDNIDIKDTELIKIQKSSLSAGLKNFIMLDEREFRLNGRMYDIVKKVDNNDTIYFYCINDKAEENLIKRFLDFGTESKTNPLGNLAIKKIKMFHFDWYELYGQPFVRAYYKLNPPHINEGNYNSLKIKPDTPPPDVS